MQRTFRLRKYHRNSGIWTSLLFGGATTGCIVGIVLDAERPLFWLLMGLFWLGMFGLGLSCLVSYFVERLEICGSRIARRTLFGRRELLLDAACTLT